MVIVAGAVALGAIGIAVPALALSGGGSAPQPTTSAPQPPSSTRSEAPSTTVLPPSSSQAPTKTPTTWTQPTSDLLEGPGAAAHHRAGLDLALGDAASCLLGAGRHDAPVPDQHEDADLSACRDDAGPVRSHR